MKAVLGGVDHGAACEDSRMLIERHGRVRALHLRVNVFRLELGGDVYALCYLSDISKERKREMLESMFLHDALNALGGILGAIRIMEGQVDSAYAELAHAAECRASQLIHDVQFLQTFFSADQGELEPVMQPVDVRALLQELKLLGAQMACAEGKKIVVDEVEADMLIVTDRRLLQRSMENLLKNALEASDKNDEVRIGVLRKGRNIHFYIRSRPYIPESVQAQMFQLSFSTKGRGRGLGTYSARMFVANYLGGAVTFETDPVEGTVFWIQLPVG